MPVLVARHRLPDLPGICLRHARTGAGRPDAMVRQDLSMSMDDLTTSEAAGPVAGTCGRTKDHRPGQAAPDPAPEPAGKHENMCLATENVMDQRPINVLGPAYRPLFRVFNLLSGVHGHAVHDHTRRTGSPADRRWLQPGHADPHVLLLRGQGIAAAAVLPPFLTCRLQMKAGIQSADHG